MDTFTGILAVIVVALWLHRLLQSPRKMKYKRDQRNYGCLQIGKYAGRDEQQSKRKNRIGSMYQDQRPQVPTSIEARQEQDGYTIYLYFYDNVSDYFIAREFSSHEAIRSAYVSDILSRSTYSSLVSSAWYWHKIGDNHILYDDITGQLLKHTEKNCAAIREAYAKQYSAASEGNLNTMNQ